MNAAVIFGTGSAACGILGQVCFQSGLQTTFVSHVPEEVHAINDNSGYFLRLFERGSQYMSIRDCDALYLREHKTIVNVIARAMVVLTAVGADNLELIAPYITAALIRRRELNIQRPLNVIACEGVPGTSEFLYHQLLARPEMRLAPELKKMFGFASAFSNRVVAGGEIEHGELSFSAEKKFEVIVDGKFLKGGALPLSDVSVCNDFTARYYQHNFTFNCALSTITYLGFQRGYRYMHEAMSDRDLLTCVNGVMQESQSALINRYPKDLSYIIKIAKLALVRLSQSSLKLRIDNFTVAPRHLFNPYESIVGPMLLAHQFAQPYTNLSKVAAAILSCELDFSSSRQGAVDAGALDSILIGETMLPADHPVAIKIKLEYSKLHNPAKKESIYHSLKSFSQSFFNF